MIVSSYDTLLLESKMPRLKVRWLRITSLETYKILKRMGQQYLHDLLVVVF